MMLTVLQTGNSARQVISNPSHFEDQWTIEPVGRNHPPNSRRQVMKPFRPWFHTPGEKFNKRGKTFGVSFDDTTNLFDSDKRIDHSEYYYLTLKNINTHRSQRREEGDASLASNGGLWEEIREVVNNLRLRDVADYIFPYTWRDISHYFSEWTGQQSDDGKTDNESGDIITYALPYIDYQENYNSGNNIEYFLKDIEVMATPPKYDSIEFDGTYPLDFENKLKTQQIIPNLQRDNYTIHNSIEFDGLYSQVNNHKISATTPNPRRDNFVKYESIKFGGPYSVDIENNINNKLIISPTIPNTYRKNPTMYKSIKFGLSYPLGIENHKLSPTTMTYPHRDNPAKYESFESDGLYPQDLQNKKITRSTTTSNPYKENPAKHESIEFDGSHPLDIKENKQTISQTTSHAYRKNSTKYETNNDGSHPIDIRKKKLARSTTTQNPHRMKSTKYESIKFDRSQTKDIGNKKLARSTTTQNPLRIKSTTYESIKLDGSHPIDIRKKKLARSTTTQNPHRTKSTKYESIKFDGSHEKDIGNKKLESTTILNLYNEIGYFNPYSRIDDQIQSDIARISNENDPRFPDRFPVMSQQNETLGKPLVNY